MTIMEQQQYQQQPRQHLVPSANTGGASYGVAYTTPPGWHPAPNGDDTFWFWNGRRWIDPMLVFEEKMTEAAERIAGLAFSEGVKHGLSLASQSALKHLQEV